MASNHSLCDKQIIIYGDKKNLFKIRIPLEHLSSGQEERI
jgi:hypothetical protein